jgi:hypothetical protein
MFRRNVVLIGWAALAVFLPFGLTAAAAASNATSGLPPRAHFDPAGAGTPGSSPKPAAGTAAASPWTALVNPPPFSPEAMIQLTDGTVMVQQFDTRNWWRLTPDSSGSYVDGTWSQLAALPSGYAPEYYASAVLPDGRVIIEGGEYNHATTGDTPTNKGAIYNPTTNKWVSVKPPSGWTSIGDAQSVVLANGQFMLAQAIQEIGGKYYCGGSNAALLNATSLTWTATGAGKNSDDDCPYDEQGWTLLPDGQVLTVDTWRTTPTEATEVYTPSTGSWTSAGNTPAPLGDSNVEMGPAALRPNGTVLAEGASGNNAIYNTTKGTWSAGPTFPGGFLTADAPSAVLPNGDVLAAASAAYTKPPEHFYLFNGTSYKLLADPPGASSTPTFATYMLDLPTGQVLVRIGSAFEVYTGTGVPSSKWLPTITSVPTTLAAGSAYTVSGLQLNGLTQGAAYGDDFQDATNFPLVRLTNNATGQVSYARSTNMSSMSVAPKNSSSANFTLPSGIATGPSTLVVVANGIASAPVAVNVT